MVRWYAQVAVRYIICSVVLFAASLLPAQVVPTFKSRTGLVLVPVLVNKGGKHLGGLTKADFTLLENGVARPIAAFEEVTVSSVARPQQRTSPGIFSNVLGTDQPQVTAIVLDLLNMPYLKQAFARQALVKFLRDLPQTDQATMLAVLTPDGLKVIHSFTQDPAALLASVHAAKGQLTLQDKDDSKRAEQEIREAAIGFSEARNKGVADMEEVDRLTDLLTAVPNYFAQAREMDITAQTLYQMRQLAGAMAGIPGRKSMLWVTGGLSVRSAPAPRSEAERRLINRGAEAGLNDLFDRTWALLSDAGIAVYPIDVGEASVPGFSDVSFMNPARTTSSVAKAQAMLGFTNNTGGKYCGLQGTLENCFRAAVEDSARYYLLSFYAGSQAKTGWHKLQVKVAAPGAQVRARSGYFFSAGTETPATRTADVTQVVTSPLDSTGISLAVHWLNPPSSEGGKVEFELFVDPQAVSFDGESLNHFHLKVTAWAGMRDLKFTGQLSKSLEATLKPASLERLQRTGVLYRDALTLPKDAMAVRFVVRDEVSGRLGSVTAVLR